MEQVPTEHERNFPVLAILGCERRKCIVRAGLASGQRESSPKYAFLPRPSTFAVVPPIRAIQKLRNARRALNNTIHDDR